MLLARALCATRKILLLDEPVTGFDPVVSGNMYRIIRDLREEKKITIVMVSHDVEGAVREARHILHIAGRCFLELPLITGRVRQDKRFWEEDRHDDSA